MSTTDAIFIRRLAVNTVIGVNDWEREQAQTLYLSLTLQVDTRPAAVTESLLDTVDYAGVATLLEDHLKDHSYQLLETLANELCTLLLDRYPSLGAVTLTVEKPDVVPGCESLGIRIYRARA